MFNLNIYKFIALAIIINSLFVSCSSEDITVATESSISYTLAISPDLLKFVTPQLYYVDENGSLVTLTGIEELDGKVIENEVGTDISTGGSKVSVSAWSHTVITGTDYKCWTLQMKFNRLNFHSYMGVKYIRNDFTEDVNDKDYNFYHSIIANIVSTRTIVEESSGLLNGMSQSSDASVYIDTHFSIASMDYHKGDNIEKYLDNLIQYSDKVGYFVDDDGYVMRKDEFDL